MEELLKSLIYIQQNLNAPKNQFNRFGNFNYRSLEDIEAAIKPLLNQQGCGIRFQDEVVEHCGRTFLKTTLIFFNDKGQSVSTTAEAEHSVVKTGMDSAQITGSASSYARKYAMNAMFCIDDSKDMDSNEVHSINNNQQPIKTTPMQRGRGATKTATSTPDRYAGIRNALNAIQTMDSLMGLYNQHKSEVEGNPEIKQMFSNKKNELLMTA